MGAVVDCRPTGTKSLGHRYFINFLCSLRYLLLISEWFRPASRMGRLELEQEVTEQTEKTQTEALKI